MRAVTFTLLLLLGLGCANSGAHEAQPFLYGLGDRVDFYLGGEWIPVWELLDRESLQVELVEIWLTQGWDTTWVSRRDLKTLHERGYTPLIVYYTWGDSSSVEYLLEDQARRLKRWYRDLEERVAPLVHFSFPVLVALEPEFNNIPSPGQTPLIEWEGFNDVVIRAVEILKGGAPNVEVGIVPGDFPGHDLSLCLGRAAPYLDFIGFQEMRAATDPEGADRPGYTDVAGAALRFSRYLWQTFRRPLLLTYVALSSYAHGNPLGWEETQAVMLQDLLHAVPALQDNGVFGLVYFELMDDPTHDTLYFGPAERYFGLITKEGRRKKAYWVWRNAVNR